MFRRTPYAFGDALDSTEVAALRALLPRKQNKMDVARMLIVLNATAPLALEFAVNRCRGFAFNAGEPGFEFKWGET